MRLFDHNKRAALSRSEQNGRACITKNWIFMKLTSTSEYFSYKMNILNTNFLWSVKFKYMELVTL